MLHQALEITNVLSGQVALILHVLVCCVQAGQPDQRAAQKAAQAREEGWKRMQRLKEEQRQKQDRACTALAKISAPERSFWKFVGTQCFQQKISLGPQSPLVSSAVVGMCAQAYRSLPCGLMSRTAKGSRVAVDSYL